MLTLFRFQELETFDEKKYSAFIAKIPNTVPYSSIVGATAQFNDLMDSISDQTTRHLLYQPIQILYFDNETALGIIKNKKIDEKLKIKILGLLTNLTTISETSQKDLNYAVATIDNKHIENITSYDYKVEKRNTFIYFHYDSLISDTPLDYLFWLSYF